jgi:hypothetical protein
VKPTQDYERESLTFSNRLEMSSNPYAYDNNQTTTSGSDDGQTSISKEAVILALFGMVIFIIMVVISVYV